MVMAMVVMVMMVAGDGDDDGDGGGGGGYGDDDYDHFVLLPPLFCIVLDNMRTLPSGDNDVVYLDIDNLSLNLFQYQF